MCNITKRPIQNRPNLLGSPMPLVTTFVFMNRLLYDTDCRMIEACVKNERRKPKSEEIFGQR